MRSEVSRSTEWPSLQFNAWYFSNKGLIWLLRMRSNQNQSDRTEKTCLQSALTATRIHSNPDLNSLKNIESGEWIILLGSCDGEYELFVRNESVILKSILNLF